GGEELAGLRHVVRVRPHVRVVRPGPGLVRPRRLAAEAQAHALDQLALVDGVGERLANPLVGEPRIAEVEPEVRVDVVLVLVLVVGLAKRRELGLTLELQRGEAGRPSRVDALRLQLEEDRRLARDDPIDDAREVRPPLEVIGIRDEDDLLAGLPLLEPVRPRPDRIRPVLRSLAQTPLLHVALQHVARQDPGGPALERLGVGLRVAHVQRVGVDGVDRADRAKILAVGGRRLGIHHRLVREDDVIGGERAAVVPAHVPAKLEGEVQTVPAELPGLGELADDVEVLVPGDEAAVDQRADLERRRVGEDVRDEARDVAGQRVDEGVAVRRLAGRLTGGAIDGAVRLAAASPERENEQPSEVTQAEAAHAPQRAGAGDAGVTGVGAAGPGAVGAAGAAGAGVLAGGGAASRTTELARSPPRMASVNDVIVKTIAMPVVILPRSVGVPIDPNTAWLPAPPNAEPMSAPLPDCSKTMPMMPKQ